MRISDANTLSRVQYHAAGIAGSGIVFAVLDTGVKQVAALKGKVTGDTRDTSNHGTFVASVLAEWCPAAHILSYCVLPGGKGKSENITKALYDVLDNAKQDRTRQYIVNMSLSANDNPASDKVRQFETAIDALVAANIPVFVAAGNDGKEAISRYPSCFQSPMTVSALTDDAKKSSFSTYHNEVDFAEHGVGVYGISTTGNRVKKNGTSFACPIVAGKAALWMCAQKQQTGKWPAEPAVYDMLKGCAVDLGADGRDKYFGWGWVDIAAAYAGPAAQEKPIKKEGESMSRLDEFIAYLELQLKNHSIYVWGAQGQIKPTITESWIRSKETSTKNADRAIAFWQKQVKAGYGDVLRAFDCSGLGMYYLQNIAGLYKNDMSSNSMLGKCKKIDRSQLAKGDWVFRVHTSGSDKGKAYHIGYVVDNNLNVIEAKGRDDGVIKRHVDATSGYWNMFGVPEIFEDEIPEPSATVLKITTPYMRGEEIAHLQQALNMMGYPCGKADGICGNDTMKGLRLFVAAHKGV